MWTSRHGGFFLETVFVKSKVMLLYFGLGFLLVFWGGVRNGFCFSVCSRVFNWVSGGSFPLKVMFFYFSRFFQKGLCWV